MLSEYENTCVQITEKEKAIETEQAELTAMQGEMEDKEQEVNSLIAKTQSSLTSKQQEISDAQSTVDEYGAQIEKMKAYEAELERKKAEEAKKSAAEQKKKEAAAKGGVECEAGGESYDGQLAVASVVVNRVKSGAFPNTVSGVIYQGGQFSPVASGRFAMVLAKGAAGSCTQAANAALSGNTNVSSLYFCQASSGVSGTVIGNHVFY
ncbi:MAG: hypothetical protein BHW44_06970 [Roseburia sp. 40_7]|nr:MAG: hypothetical protein BHW44_06970 [Roseburia sp. 40_7]